MNEDSTQDWRKRLGIEDAPPDHPIYKEPPRAIFLNRRAPSAAAGPTEAPSQPSPRVLTPQRRLMLRVLRRRVQEGLRSQSELTDESNSPTTPDDAA